MWRLPHLSSRYSSAWSCTCAIQRVFRHGEISSPVISTINSFRFPRLSPDRSSLLASSVTRPEGSTWHSSQGWVPTSPDIPDQKCCLYSLDWSWRPLSSKHGTYKKVKTRSCPQFSGNSPHTYKKKCSPFARQQQVRRLSGCINLLSKATHRIMVKSS